MGRKGLTPRETLFGIITLGVVIAFIMFFGGGGIFGALRSVLVASGTPGFVQLLVLLLVLGAILTGLTFWRGSTGQAIWVGGASLIGAITLAAFGSALGVSVSVFWGVIGLGLIVLSVYLFFRGPKTMQTEAIEAVAILIGLYLVSLPLGLEQWFYGSFFNFAGEATGPAGYLEWGVVFGILTAAIFYRLKLHQRTRRFVLLGWAGATVVLSLVFEQIDTTLYSIFIVQRNPIAWAVATVLFALMAIALIGKNRSRAIIEAVLNKITGSARWQIHGATRALLLRNYEIVLVVAILVALLIFGAVFFLI